MRAICLVACVLVACSSDPSGGGMQPEGVGDGGGVRPDAPQEIVDAIARLEDENAEPSACAYFTASLIAWVCLGTEPGVVDVIGLIDFGVESWGGSCGEDGDFLGFENIEPSCVAADIDDAALYCAAYAASQNDFVCCLEGTPLYGDVLDGFHDCD